MTTFTLEQLEEARDKLRTGFGRDIPLWRNKRVNCGVRRWWAGDANSDGVPLTVVFLQPEVYRKVLSNNVPGWHKWEKLHFYLGSRNVKVHPTLDFWGARLEYCSTKNGYSLYYKNLSSYLVDHTECPPMDDNFLNNYVEVFNSQFEKYEPVFTRVSEELRVSATNLEALLDIQGDDL